MLSRQPFQAYAESYLKTDFRAANQLLEDGRVRAPESGDLTRWQQADIDRLGKRGLI